MDALEHADEETVYQRFLRAPVRLSPGQVERLTELDYRTRMAVAAFDASGTGVGIARYEPVSPGTVEIAVVVDPAWRRCGLASALLTLLESHARSQAIDEIVAIHLPSNTAVTALLARHGYTLGAPDGGLCTSVRTLRP